MTETFTAEQYVEKIEEHCSADGLALIERYFRKAEPGAEFEDVILELSMSHVLRSARPFVEMPLDQVERLLGNSIHELRAGALRIMGDKATKRKVQDADRRELYDLYMRHKEKVNSWGLVDISSHHIVGAYLFDKPRDVLYEMARSDDWWERRIALVSTLYFVRKKDLDDTYAIAEIVLHDDHPKVQTAVGWLLRDAGKHDRDRLLKFLDVHAATLPRVALRASIEHLDKDQRAHYLAMGKQTRPKG